jgi:predicted SAM-dependent methyltransferase
MTPAPRRLLHLGCGLHAPAGWVNVDGSPQVVLARRPLLKRVLVALRLVSREQAAIPWSASVVRLDLARPLPYPDASFAAVYSSHLLEHLYRQDAQALLQECFRVLAPGGVCRAVVPDIEALVERYRTAKARGDPEAAERLMEQMLVHDKARARGLRGAYYRLTAMHQHKWMYDAASLARLFAAAGFTDVRPAACLESRIARIAEVEDAGRLEGGEGIAVEGVKAGRDSPPAGSAGP